MTGRSLYIALFALLLAWPAVAVDDRPAAKTSAVTTTSGSVMPTRQAGGEEWINGRGACPAVSIDHADPGADVPTIGTIAVPEKSRQTLSFRGPGDTRIASDRFCPESAEEWEGDPAARSPGCVQFGQDYGGDAVLVNPCAVCRTAVIERIDIGGNLSRRAYAVSPRSSVGVVTDGLARARIIRDDPCG